MDIESMHPFCLPFSLCHDATSSIMSIDTESTFETTHNDDATTGIDTINTTRAATDTTVSRNSDNISKEQSNRSGASSPSEGDLLNDLSAKSPSSCRSLLNDDSLIGSSGDDATGYYALHLDIDAGHGSALITDSFGLLEDDEDCDGNLDICRGDDWLSSNYSLLSPTNSIHNSSNTKHKKPFYRSRTSHLSAHNHLVFQNVVDSIDIKSSPTLAQLNLNSNDDPTDGIWDNGNLSPAQQLSSTALTVSATKQTDLDLLSNCTSINTGVNNCSHLVGCNHHHQADYIHRYSISIPNHHSTSSPYPNRMQSNSQVSPTCHRGPQYQNLRNHNHHNSLNQNSAQNTCPTVATSKVAGPDFDQYRNHSQCCQHAASDNLVASSYSRTDIANQQNSSGHFLKPSEEQLKQRLQANGGSDALQSIPALPPIDSLYGQRTVVVAGGNQHQRCASPALVTSSSSPLAASSALEPASKSSSTDYMLRENIEYLTALLCNGNNKLPDNMANSTNNTQQPTISSTMVKTYTNLAQSLSTGPKLLERHQHPSSVLVANQQQAAVVQVNQQMNVHVGACGVYPQAPISTSICTAPAATSEATPQQQISQTNPYHQQFNADGTCTQEQWFKPAVESSVSAADSTAENHRSVAANCSNLTRPPVIGPSMSPCPQQVHGQHQHVIRQDSGNVLGQITKAPELKVLSSLLGSNARTGTACHGLPNVTQSNNGTCAGWQAECQHHHQPSNEQLTRFDKISTCSYQEQQQQQKSQDIEQQDANSTAPINGKPITLTPISSNNGFIIQQHRQQVLKSKVPLFAQPASPSASSTTSSSGNNEIGSSSTVVPIKRPRISQANSPLAKKDSVSRQRSAQPNSMSTDCSLSSHDEGFSSQVDNDDCGSARDSDEEDDVDSDDESFYGDYTNNDLIGASISDDAECKWTLNMGRTRRNGQKRYFWQYNVQSKGPKGTRICSTDGSEDPFVLPEASDPVFSSSCQIEGVKHSGKARRGDGNDLTPNPRKLLMIGLELKKLSKIINDLAPVTDLPVNARNKTRKEKNKLASRACRLKKKAQHEANKIKLYGLQREHQQVVLAVYDVRKLMRDSLDQSERSGGKDQQSSVSLGATTIAERCSITVAGQTSDYVNSVLEKVVSGCIDGGLQT